MLNVRQERCNIRIVLVYIPATPQLCSVASPTDIGSLAPDPTESPGSTDLSSVYDVICRVSQAAEEVCINQYGIRANTIDKHRHSDHFMKIDTNILQTLLVRKSMQIPSDPVSDEECEVGLIRKINLQNRLRDAISRKIIFAFFFSLSMCLSMRNADGFIFS